MPTRHLLRLVAERCRRIVILRAHRRSELCVERVDAFAEVGELRRWSKGADACLELAVHGERVVVRAGGAAHQRACPRRATSGWARAETRPWCVEESAKGVGGLKEECGHQQ